MLGHGPMLSGPDLRHFLEHLYLCGERIRLNEMQNESATESYGTRSSGVFGGPINVAGGLLDQQVAGPQVGGDALIGGIVDGCSVNLRRIAARKVGRTTEYFLPTTCCCGAPCRSTGTAVHEYKQTSANPADSSLILTAKNDRLLFRFRQPSKHRPAGNDGPGAAPPMRRYLSLIAPNTDFRMG
jgi:hypothetical protein